MSEQKRLGDILLEQEIITQDDLLRAIEVQRDTGERLGSVLLRLQMIDAGMLVKVLGEHLNCTGINLCETPPRADAVALISQELAMRYGCIPVSIDGDSLAVAMIDPRDEEIVAALAAHTGRQIRRFVAPQTTIYAAIKRYYGVGERIDENELRALVRELKALVLRLDALVGS